MKHISGFSLRSAIAILLLLSLALSFSACLSPTPVYDSATTVERTEEELERINTAYEACILLCDDFRESGGDVTTNRHGQYYVASLKLSTYDLTEENAVAICALLGYTSYENYWLDRRFLVDGGQLYITINEEFLTASSRAAADSKIETAVTEISREITVGDSIYEKCLAIHDYICDKTSYARDTAGEAVVSSRTVSLVTVLEGGEVVCQGYARAFGYFCHRFGISCESVVGPEHIWNRVKLDDDKWYDVDVTFDDENSTHKYFCAGSETFGDGHHGICNTANVYEFFYFDLPQIGAKDYNPARWELL